MTTVEAWLPPFDYLGSAIAGDTRRRHAVYVSDGVAANRTVCGMSVHLAWVHTEVGRPIAWSTLTAADPWGRCKKCEKGLRV